MKTIFISGDGVAACCCAYLLKRAGMRVFVRRSERPRLPAILLSEAALALIQGVFGDLCLANSHRIGKRVVAWGPDAEPVTVDHSALVISGRDLLEKLWSRVDLDPEGESDWTIFAARPLPPGAIEQPFGTRKASVMPVTLKDSADSSACWIESLDNGWLFLIPNRKGAGLVLAVGDLVVGDGADSLLHASRVVTKQIAERAETTGQFPAHPCVLSSLCGDAWLACGTAAMAFDPLCGDGTSHAVREAILAAAIIQAEAGGESPEQLRSHYETRLFAGFGRHLALCSQFYRTGHRGLWWQTELELLKQGMSWCGQHLEERANFRYQLNGFELEPAIRA